MSPKPQHRHRRWIAAVLSAAITAGLVVVALAKLNIAGVGRTLTDVRPGWLALAVIAMILAFLARAESWSAVLAAALPAVPLGRGVVRRGLFIGMVGSTVAPGRVGEAARTWVIARRLRHPRRGLAVVVGTLLSQTLLNLLALVLLTIVALSSGSLTTARVSAVILAVALPTGLVTLLLAGPALLEGVTRVRWRRLAAAGAFLQRQVLLVRRGLRTFGGPTTAAHAGSFQLLAWTLQLLMCWAVLRALGLHPGAPVAAAAAVLVAVNLTAIVPVTPSNVGVFQAACIAVLSPFGVGAARGLAYGLLLQAVEIGCAFVLGAPALMREGLSLAHPARSLASATEEALDDGSPDAAVSEGAARSELTSARVT